MFGYFTQLVEAYSKVLIPRNEALAKLTKYQQDSLEVLRSAGERYLWEKMQDEEHRKKNDKEDDNKDEQMQDNIDWYDFVVVEKIDLYDDEEMKEVEEQEEKAAIKQLSSQIKQQIEENQALLKGPEAATNEVVISTALDKEMKVKKNYTRGKEEEKKTTGTQKCPKCLQEVPIAEWREHMKLELMNPKWREEKLKREQRAALNTLAQGDEIAVNLRKFANERRDIFPNA